jgi:hypothetical protein
LARKGRKKEESGVVSEVRFGGRWLGFEPKVWDPRLLDLYPGPERIRRKEADALIKRSGWDKTAEMVISPHLVPNLVSIPTIGKSLNGIPGVLAGFPGLRTGNRIQNQDKHGGLLKKYDLELVPCPGSA